LEKIRVIRYYIVMFPIHNLHCHIAIQVVAGGGAVEAALSGYLECLATTLGSREQLAIAEFAESLLIIPKVYYNLWVHDISSHPH
jgi:chaperonin GroEL (HSP60 family)